MPTEPGFSPPEKAVTKKARREGEKEPPGAGLESEKSLWTHVYFDTQISVSICTYTEKCRYVCVPVFVYIHPFPSSVS